MSGSPPPERPLAPHEYFAVPGWRAAPATRTLPPGPTGGPYAVLDLDERGELGARVAQRLTQLGERVQHIGGSDRGALRGVLDAHSADQAAVRIIACTASPRVSALDTLPGRDDARKAIGGPLAGLVAIGNLLATRADRRPAELVMVTSGAIATDRNDPADPLMALTTGPRRAITAELAHVACRQVDLPASNLPRPSDAAVEELCDELRGPFAPTVVALRDERRWVRSFAYPELHGDVVGTPWRQGGVYLITGGLGGLGLVLAEHLAGEHGARLALMSRTKLPPPAQWAAARAAGSRLGEVIEGLERVERHGGEVAVFAADVADVDALAGVRAEIMRRFGALHGIVHAAGVWPGPHDGLLEVRSEEVAGPVLGPKVLGTLALDSVFGGDPLDLVVLFSSISSFLGGFGLVDYCAGNAFMDAYAHSPARRLPNVTAVNWGGWLETGMWAPYAKGDPGILNSEGPELLRRALMSVDEPQVIICPVRVQADDAAPDDSTPALDDPLVKPLCALWGEALSRPPVGPDDSFEALGGDSMTCVQLVWRIVDEFGCKVPMREVRDSPTPRLMALAIGRLCASEEPPAAQATATAA